MSDLTTEPTPEVLEDPPSAGVEAVTLDTMEKPALLELAASLGLEFTARHGEATIRDGIRARQAELAAPPGVAAADLQWPASQQIALAGLLAAEPDLRHAVLPVEAWEQHLQSFLKSKHP